MFDIRFLQRPHLHLGLARATRGGHLQQGVWPAPQQRKGAEDFAFTVMVFMLQLPGATAYPSKALL